MYRKVDPSFKILKNHSSSAFTIVELLVVIVVIGILAAITIVSYSGISNRATISSLQSDLTNASTTLKLDYVSNGTFPATLASANGGKGITQSQTLDNIIYIPDNTSNPNNFCLQYRKGNDTYAIDNNSAVTKGVCLKNLVSNGDFRSGTSGWSGEASSVSVSGGVISGTASGIYNYSAIDQDCSNCAVSGHKLYAIYQEMVTNSSSVSLGINISDPLANRSFSTGINNPIANQWYLISGIVTFAATGNMTFKPTQAYVDAATANGKIMELRYVAAFDLTTTFGAGSEPTKSQMDTIMNDYPNNWFNIVAKVNL